MNLVHEVLNYHPNFLRHVLLVLQREGLLKPLPKDQHHSHSCPPLSYHQQQHSVMHNSTMISNIYIQGLSMVNPLSITIVHAIHQYVLLHNSLMLVFLIKVST